MTGPLSGFQQGEQDAHLGGGEPVDDFMEALAVAHGVSPFIRSIAERVGAGVDYAGICHVLESRPAGGPVY